MILNWRIIIDRPYRIIRSNRKVEGLRRDDHCSVIDHDFLVDGIKAYGRVRVRSGESTITEELCGCWVKCVAVWDNFNTDSIALHWRITDLFNSLNWNRFHPIEVKCVVAASVSEDDYLAQGDV